jgi:nickel-dependent lactate racemase
MKPVRSLTAPPGRVLRQERIAAFLRKSLDPALYERKNILLIIPDSTRSGPFHSLVRRVLRILKPSAAKVDILIALGTHPPMSAGQIGRFLKISASDRRGVYRNVGIFNHEWDRKGSLRRIGVLDPATVRRLTRGLFCESVPVEVNRRVFDYDRIVVLGPVFPHEVVGFSGGWKYFFPGICGPDFLDFFHWLGAVITNVRVNGVVDTPVRALIHAAAGFVPKPCSLIALDVQDGRISAMYSGDMIRAWREAAQRARKTHIVTLRKRFRTVLGIASPLYDDLWTAGKVMYKLESVVEDGGELIIYAPHVTEISYTHGKILDRIGYHVRDYFLKRMERFKGVPRGVMAHSTHVKGTGTYAGGVERPRITVTLATGIPESRCRRINLGYRDWKKIRVGKFENRETEGILVVRNAGETLYRR